MRDVLVVVAIVGLLGIMFVLALATTKFGEALEKQRQADAGALRAGDTSDQPEPAPVGRQREKDIWLLVVVGILAIGIVIGQVLANALDISGVSQILVCGAVIFVLTWCVVGVLMLRTHRRNRSSSH